MLTLRGTDFGSVFCAPGARGFFGEGYPYHRVTSKLGMTWEGTGFVSKTIVWPSRQGNMPFKEDRLTPREWFIPRSIVVKPFSGHVLNAVALSGPGAQWAFEAGWWQERTEPFMISFMSVAPTREERLEETKKFAALLRSQLPFFKAPVAVQFNRACPNTGHPPEEFFAETNEQLDVLATIGVPIVVNFNSVVPVEVLVVTAEHPACDALWIANTIPWGDDRIDWELLFGSKESPLAKRKLPVPGSGGLSGPACLPITRKKVIEARKAGITKPIVAGNGVQRKLDAALLRDVGADGVAIGCVAMLRPWRMRSIIETTKIFDRKEGHVRSDHLEC